jgi:hypothetical protein
VKHGLSLPVLQNPILAPEVARLAAAISGGRDELLELAIPVAEAQVVLLRARRLRSELIDRALKDPHFILRANSAAYVRLLGRAERGRNRSVQHSNGKQPSSLNARPRAPFTGTPALSRS